MNDSIFRLLFGLPLCLCLSFAGSCPARASAAAGDGLHWYIDDAAAEGALTREEFELLLKRAREMPEEDSSGDLEEMVSPEPEAKEQAPLPESDPREQANFNQSATKGQDSLEGRMESFAGLVRQSGLAGAGVGSIDFSGGRLQGLAALVKGLDAKYGPVVRDVVRVIGGSGTVSKEEARMQALSGLAHKASIEATPKTHEIATKRQERSFPTTDWERFGSELEDMGSFVLTAYDPCLICCGKTDGITATGTKGMAGRTIAVDPAVIPYGSRVLIGGHVFIAEDTGSKIRGNHVDLFMDTHEVAVEFGRREANVYLIK